MKLKLVATVFILLAILLFADAGRGCRRRGGKCSGEKRWRCRLRQANKVCYPVIGCFYDIEPFHDRPLPMDPAVIAPRYYRYRKDTPAEEITDANVLNVTDLIVVVHGVDHTRATSEPWLLPLVQSVHRKWEDREVLFVEWEVGGSLGGEFNFQNYLQPASNTQVIGRLSIVFLQNNPLFNPESAWFIGFSAGAHVCGYAGKWARKLFKKRLGRITGLDPGGPLFENSQGWSRLDKKDAKFVDIIHTSLAGILRPVGHIDFYMNGGMLQPGCVTPQETQETLLLLQSAPVDASMFELIPGLSCSHGRAVEFFTASLLHHIGCTFPACRCNSKEAYFSGTCSSCSASDTQLMGYPSILSPQRGVFYGAADDVMPYCFSLTSGGV